MDSTALKGIRHFRQGLYGCFERAADALRDACDALLTQSEARSFAELSLSPCFRRGWASLYEALEDAQMERSTLRRVFAGALPLPVPGERRVLGLDASPRCQSHRACALAHRQRPHLRAYSGGAAPPRQKQESKPPEEAGRRGCGLELLGAAGIAPHTQQLDLSVG